MISLISKDELMKLNNQVNVRLTKSDIDSIKYINEIKFGSEANNSMICRYLIKLGIEVLARENDEKKNI